MAGSAAIVSNEKCGKWRTIIWKWTSSTGGAVSDVGKLHIPGGSVHSFWSVPGSGVTDDFDLTLPGKFTLKNGEVISVADLLHGVGTDLSNSTNGEIVNVDVVLPVGYNTEIAPVIASAGSAVSGYLFLYIWEE
jgi:hypothetical protein